MFLEAIVCKRALKALLMASRKSACLAKSKTQKVATKHKDEMQVFSSRRQTFVGKETALKQSIQMVATLLLTKAFSFRFILS